MYMHTIPHVKIRMLLSRFVQGSLVHLMPSHTDLQHFTATVLVDLKVVAPNLAPEVFVESTGNDTAFKEELYSGRITLRYLKVEVLPPVLQLESLQWLYVEIGPLYLVCVCVGEEKKGVRVCVRTTRWSKRSPPTIISKCFLLSNSAIVFSNTAVRCSRITFLT